MNTQVKHTPGPWRADDDEQIMLEDQIPMLLENKGTDREWVSVGEYDEEGMLSVVALCHPNNAHLIAAAPALLEALRLAEHNLTEIENYIGGDAVPAGLLDTVRAAIAQAEGGTTCAYQSKRE